MRVSRSLIAAIIIGLLALGLSERTLTPVRSVVDAVIYPISRPVLGLTQSVRSIVTTVHAIGTLRQTVTTLTNRNEVLTAQVAQLQALQHDNAALRSALGFSQAHGDEHVVAAEIVGRSPSTFLQSVTIDRGTADGVALHAPVVPKPPWGG